MLLAPRLMENPTRPADRIEVLLVDRHPLFLAALAEVLNGLPSIPRVQTTTSSDRAVEIALNEPIDLVFCEGRAEPIAGAEVAARLIAAGSKARVILLAEREDHSLLVSSLACGAVGFFTKDASPDEFLEGIGFILAGHYVVSADLLQLTLARMAGLVRTDRRDLGQLSPSERSILVMVAQAHSVRNIAASRGVSQKTVRNHLASIYRKLELRNRSEAILWSARRGLTDSSPSEISFGGSGQADPASSRRPSRLRRAGNVVQIP
jgi:DNA-binding NarL/FixJ family response regulator